MTGMSSSNPIPTTTHTESLPPRALRLIDTLTRIVRQQATITSTTNERRDHSITDSPTGESHGRRPHTPTTDNAGGRPAA